MGLIKVAIADDHKIFRKGVILSLRAYSNIKFVQEAENGQELLDGLHLGTVGRQQVLLRKDDVIDEDRSAGGNHLTEA